MEDLIHVPALVSLEAANVLPRQCPNFELVASLDGSLSSTPAEVCLGVKTLIRDSGQASHVPGESTTTLDI